MFEGKIVHKAVSAVDDWKMPPQWYAIVGINATLRRLNIPVTNFQVSINDFSRTRGRLENFKALFDE